MIRVVIVLLVALAGTGCMRRVDVGAPGEEIALRQRRVKMIVRDGGGTRHALVVDVHDVGPESVRGRIVYDAVETRGGLWAEVKPSQDAAVIPFGDILEVQRGPTGEEIAQAVVAGCIAGLCEAAVSGALK